MAGEILNSWLILHGDRKGCAMDVVDRHGSENQEEDAPPDVHAGCHSRTPDRSRREFIYAACLRPKGLSLKNRVIRPATSRRWYSSIRGNRRVGC
jgi:hypothetical protein